MNNKQKDTFPSALLVGFASSLLYLLIEQMINIPPSEWQLYLATNTIVGIISFGLVSCLYLLFFGGSKRKTCIILIMAVICSFIIALIAHSIFQGLTNSEADVCVFNLISLSINIIAYTTCMLIFFDLTKNLQSDSKNAPSFLKRIQNSRLFGFAITIAIFTLILLAANVLFLHWF